MSEVTVEQGTGQWLKARCGLVTGSRVCDVLAVLKRKDGEAAARRDYKAEIICEILTGITADHYVTPAMQWGNEQEPFARAAYELETDTTVDLCGFFIHPTNKRFGASPDGLIGEEGVLELKCPTTATHLEWLLAGEVPAEHAAQMMAEMACTERQWCDFVSYDPRMPRHLSIFIKRLNRDDEWIGKMLVEVDKFLGEIDDILARLPKEPASIGQDIVEAMKG